MRKKASMNTYISILLPLVGGIYGGFAGGYFYSKRRSPRWKHALVAGGVILLLMCITVLYMAFAA